jgi:hypothetical protein
VSRHQERVGNEGNGGPRMEGRGGRGSRGGGWGESCPDNGDGGGPWTGGGWGVGLLVDKDDLSNYQL